MKKNQGFLVTILCEQCGNDFTKKKKTHEELKKLGKKVWYHKCPYCGYNNLQK